ncbi:response regulator [Variovorax rhizosphaerae]|uniref:Response regulator n=1 Tax=Variovorax rhizosphaerae TaxID=1836200 RepID=A0ABU8WT82_9BURK
MPRVLIVEDNDADRDALSRRLVRQGFEIAVAMDGAGAIERARMESPDLILLDWSLPVIESGEAARRLKADPGTQSIPIIALTAQGAADEAERALDAGCNDVDTKPIDLPRLLSKINRALGLPDRVRTLHTPPRGGG